MSNTMRTDETLFDDLTTVNRNSSLSIVYRARHVHHYIREEFVDRTLFAPSRSMTGRDIAIMEFITSEQRFVQDMKNILQTFVEPLLENEILSVSHVDALFLNWSSLTRIHEKLANSLAEIHSDLKIGEIFNEFFPELVEEYEIYFRFHSIAMKCFHSKFDRCSKFRSFMEKAKRRSSGIGTLGDANILTLPLQRIAKYPFLLFQILKETPNHFQDHDHLETSFHRANELRSTINNVIDDEINRTKFDWLQKNVDLKKINEILIFNSLTHFGEQRKLIHYSFLRLPRKTRFDAFFLRTKSADHYFYAMLFNDFLLLTCLKWPVLTKILQIFHRIGSFSCQKQSNFDWFDQSENSHLNLIVYKQPMMLHEIRHVDIFGKDSTAFQFDFRAEKIILFARNIHERILWMKSLINAVDDCRRRRFQTAMLRAPERNANASLQRPVATIKLEKIAVENLPFSSVTPYCVMEMKNGQRQTTPIICDSSHFQWNICFQFFITNIHEETIRFSIFNRSKYTMDRLLGSIEIRLFDLIENFVDHDELSSIDSFVTSPTSSCCSSTLKQRSFHLQNSSNNCQISIGYRIDFVH